MQQVYYRQPLTTDTIQFENTTIMTSDTIYNNTFSGTNSRLHNVSGFSHGESQRRYVSHGIIPVYYPEFDSFVINFD